METAHGEPMDSSLSPQTQTSVKVCVYDNCLYPVPPQRVVVFAQSGETVFSFKLRLAEMFSYPNATFLLSFPTMPGANKSPSLPDGWCHMSQVSLLLSTGTRAAIAFMERAPGTTQREFLNKPSQLSIPLGTPLRETSIVSEGRANSTASLPASVATSPSSVLPEPLTVQIRQGMSVWEAGYQKSIEERSGDVVAGTRWRVGEMRDCLLTSGDASRFRTQLASEPRTTNLSSPATQIQITDGLSEPLAVVDTDENHEDACSVCLEPLDEEEKQTALGMKLSLVEQKKLDSIRINTRSESSTTTTTVTEATPGAVAMTKDNQREDDRESLIDWNLAQPSSIGRASVVVLESCDHTFHYECIKQWQSQCLLAKQRKLDKENSMHPEILPPSLLQDDGCSSVKKIRWSCPVCRTEQPVVVEKKEATQKKESHHTTAMQYVRDPWVDKLKIGLCGAEHHSNRPRGTSTWTSYEEMSMSMFDIAEDDTEVADNARGEESNNAAIPESDIELVMTQANCTRERSLQALVKTNGDIVNAIMELTM